MKQMRKADFGLNVSKLDSNDQEKTMRIFQTRIMTNWLLSGIFIVLVLNLWVKTVPSANAETLLLDNCVTMSADETPKQYVHVVAHAPKESR